MDCVVWYWMVENISTVMTDRSVEVGVTSIAIVSHELAGYLYLAHVVPDMSILRAMC